MTEILGNRGSLRFLATFALCSLLLAASASTSPVQAQSGDTASPIRYVADPPVKSAGPLRRSTGPQAFPFTSSQCRLQFGFSCYKPADIRTAYNIPADLTGAGQTIAIVVAYGSPTVEEDLHAFSEEFSLPDAKLDVIYPAGRPSFKPEQRPEQLAWAAETSLDVQWAHAIAPQAEINLVVAPNSDGNTLNLAQRHVVENRLGEVMTLSFGAAEKGIAGEGNNLNLKQAHKVYEDARAANIGVFAAAGDRGAENGYEAPNALFPASDPLVTAVGGTALFTGENGAYADETVWNDAVPDLCPFGCRFGGSGATGGAASKIFDSPPYQRALSRNAARTTADVSYNASSYTSVLVYLGYLGSDSGFHSLGGTSAGTPQWAAIGALANEAAGRPLGFLNPALYYTGADPAKYASGFHDVTVGHNGLSGKGLGAGPGYDLPTGLGTPDVDRLVDILVY